MKRWQRCLVVSSVLLVGCGGASTPELQLIEEAAEAMGGLRAVRDTTALTLEGEGRVYRLGQNTSPRADLPYYEIENYQLRLDFENGRWQEREDRTSTFLTGSPLYGARQVRGLDGDVAYDEEGGDTTRSPDRVAAERRLTMYHNPVGIVRLALDETSTVSNLREEDGYRILDIAASNGTQFTLRLNAETHLPRSVTSATYHPNLGDVALETSFGDYAQTAGLAGFQSQLFLPRSYRTELDRFTIAEYVVRTDPHVDVGDLTAPAGLTMPPDEVIVEVAELAEGVWQIGGQSHHSALVEFDEYLLLVEAPQSEARTLAVIARARELRPDKPLRYVLNTHHHFDHSAGIRAAVSEGLTVITHEVNRSFFEELVARRHSLEQDALARNPQPLTLEVVTGDDAFELSGGARTVQIFRIVDDPHSEGSVMAYLPAERILIQVDAFSPAAREAPFAQALLNNIEERGLRVDTIVPLHGAVSPFEELESAVRRATEL